jgi:uncharacterized membrane protein YheB (UPF0754 family)
MTTKNGKDSHDNSNEDKRIALTHQQVLMMRYGEVIQTRDQLEVAHGSVSDVLDDVKGLLHTLANGETIHSDDIASIQAAVVVAQTSVDQSLTRADNIVYTAGMLFEASDAGIREVKDQRDEVLRELIELKTALDDPYWTEHPLVKKLVEKQNEIRRREAQKADFELMMLITENEELKRQLSEVLGIEPRVMVVSFEDAGG